MRKKNLHSDVFFRHQGGYSLKKLWFHLMLLDFERECGLSQSMDSAGTGENSYESDPEEHNHNPFHDSENDPEEHNHKPFHDSENSYSKEHPRFISDPEIPKLFEAMRLEADRRYREGYSGAPDDEVTEEIRLLLYKYFPKDDPDATKDREKIKAFFEEANYHIEKYFNGPCFGGGFRGFGGGLRDRDREKDVAMIRAVLNKHFPKGDPGAKKDRENKNTFSGEANYIVERYPKDPSYGGDPQEDNPDYGSDTDGPDYGSDTDGPDYGSDTDGPDYGSDTDGPDYGSDPDGHFYGSDPDDHFYESDPEDYLQKKRNPGGDYLQIDRYPEETCLKIERDPQKIDRYIEEPYLDSGSNPQEDDPDSGSDPQEDDPDYGSDPQEDNPDYGSDPQEDNPDYGSDPDGPDYGSDPQEDNPDYGSDPQEDNPDSGSHPNPRKNYTHKYKHLWLMCDECYTLNYRRFLNEKLYICEGCGFHLKMNSSERLKLLIDPDTWDPMNEKMASLDPIEFHSEEDPYIDRINSYQKKTGLTEAIQTGLGQLNGIPIAMGVMEFGFMGGSMGSVVGEKITRLVEYATNKSLPLIIVCASGGARMQEGSLSLMQMAKISSCLYDFQTNKKLFYVSILTSPTTGGVTASFGMLGDVIVAEPDAYIAFAGKRVIELTLNKEVPEGSQETEYLFEKGLFDLVVPRKDLKSILTKLFGSHGFFPFTLNQNHSSITEH
uniref:acetyl-CoA carboxylase carboxyltransferase beta subunit n=1 Tax=Lonicera fragrantissima TaxID=486666 RepID=UPI001D0F8FE4|nr:acetyl-CoA carboxylase carboxyltransferase beta subunit [Lonicera fragrantissima]QZL37978.1 acetyl-CoA carboxylase carboxyltransferase beta subunit [Lonicera fragrantissima]WID87418.1 acetyl-CoA carboxylase beta subunit [Lonicera fragrantissima]